MPYKEIVTARVVSRQNHQPVSGATVRVYDKDLVLNDFLGEATTDSDGHFSVTFPYAGHARGASRIHEHLCEPDHEALVADLGGFAHTKLEVVSVWLGGCGSRRGEQN